jgi:hypothetical protein
MMNAYRKSTIALMLAALAGVLSFPASAQRREVFTPQSVSQIDSSKLSAVAKLQPSRQLAELKRMSDIDPAIKSKTSWAPFLRLTPQKPIATAGYWYFQTPAVYTPHWYQGDEGVAIFVQPLLGGDQMSFLFNGQPNQGYALDVTVWVNDRAQYRIEYAVDGNAVTPKLRKFERQKPGFEHLVIDLPASTSGSYKVGIRCTAMGEWWAFYSLEVGSLK